MSSNHFIVVSIFFFTADSYLRPPMNDDVIQNTEDIVRNTVNTLFSILNLTGVKDKQKLKEYATMHKYFASQSLRYAENSKHIRKVTENEVTNKSSYFNNTDFIDVINCIVNEDKESNKVDDVSVEMYVNLFIENIKRLRDAYAPNTVYVSINTNVLEHLKQVKPLNATRDNTADQLLASDNEFWEPSGRRIYKGERTKIKYFPFVASVHIFNNFHCAGSIIKSDLVITASSCLQLAYNNRLFRENPAFLSVRIGSSFYSGGGEVIPVLEVYFHPGYDPKTLRNNLAVMRLSRHIKFSRRNKRVKRIDFDRNAYSLPLTTPGITILGWGAKGKSGVIYNPLKNILSFAILDIYPRRDCEDVYSKEYVTKKHFCAGFMSKGGGACNRDVGGPGVADGKLIGVVSFGSPTCGTPDAPTVFTKLGYYSDWIEDIMEKKPPTSLKSTTLKLEFDFLKAMFPTERPMTTTFKIAPITGKTLKPLSILDIEKALRLLDDNLFKDFVSTMFTSKEVKDYHEIVSHRTTEATTEIYTAITSAEMPDAVEFVTQMPESNEDVETTKAAESDSSSSVEEGTHRDIVKFMQDIDLKKIIREEVKVTPHVKVKTDRKKNNGSVVTFLYLTDEERVGNGGGDEHGLSIQADEELHTFEDMTRTKSKHTAPPENQHYGLLSNVIETEVDNKLLNDKE